MRVKTTVTHSLRWFNKKKKTLIRENVGEDVEKLGPSKLLEERSNGIAILESSFAVPQNVKHKVTYDPASQEQTSGNSDIVH
jgi:hypothetical protein